MQGMPPMAPGQAPYAPGQFPPPGGMFPQGYRPPRPPRGGAAPPPAGALPAGVPAGAPRGGNAPAAPAQPEVLTAAALANASPEEQKQMLGEAIYPKIAASQPQLAGKLTGMILELPVGELLHLLEDDEALASKVDEALTVLREYETREGTQAPN